MFGRRRSRSASVPDSHRISPENINLLAVAGDLSTFTVREIK